MRDRVDAFGVAEPELQLLGERADRGQPARRRGRRPRGATRSARPPSCSSTTGKRTSSTRTASTNPDEVNGGQQRDHAGSTRRSSGAQVQAADRRATASPPPRRASTPSTRSPSSRSTNAQALRVARGGARRADDAEKRANAEVLEVPEGVLVVRDEKGPVGKDGKEPPEPDRWWVIQDNPALSGTDIKNPEQNFDQQRRRRARSSRSTSRTRAARRSRTITRRIAQRGVDNALPGVDPQNASQHFAIVLDDELVSRAVHQLPGEPGRHRRLDRRADLRRLHDPVRAGPGEDPPDRRAADQARADLALAGLGHASAPRRSTRA